MIFHNETTAISLLFIRILFSNNLIKRKSLDIAIRRFKIVLCNDVFAVCGFTKEEIALN